MGSCRQLPQEAEESLGTELLSSLAPAGSKAAGVDLATVQEAIAAFPASVWGRGAEVPAMSPLYIGRHMQGQLEGPAETIYFMDGETEAYGGGRDSLNTVGTL